MEDNTNYRIGPIPSGLKSEVVAQGRPRYDNSECGNDRAIERIETYSRVGQVPIFKAEQVERNSSE